MEKKPVNFPATPELLAWKKGYDSWISQFNAILSRYNDLEQHKAGFGHGKEASEKRWEDMMRLTGELRPIQGEGEALAGQLYDLIYEAQAKGYKLDYDEIKAHFLDPLKEGVPRLLKMLRKLMRDELNEMR